MKKMLLLCLCLIVSDAAFAQPAVDGSRRKKVAEAVSKALSWLASKQAENGSWSNPRFPALTGLPLWAMSISGEKAYSNRIAAAVEFIKGCAQKDGGIYVPDPRRGGAGLGNYNTSVCMTALHFSGVPDTLPLVLKAREYTARTQLVGDDGHSGGFGYDRGGRRHSDLSNTAMAIDAMRLTQSAEDLRPAGSARADLNWDKALAYVSSMQEKDGGFLYVKNSQPKKEPGSVPVKARPRLSTYGSITYDGLLALMHCRLTRTDPRVVSALDYCTRHWTLEENPGQGQQGIYFYYDVLVRALDAAGVDMIKTSSGGNINWRDEVVDKLVSLQKPEGFWVNSNNRWWEADPVLSTSYALIALLNAVKQ